jgi:CheY-like chemotaxis protein
MSENKQLLIVDDDPDFVAATDVAHNPKDGFAALHSKRYDLLLLDIMMGRGAEGVMMARKIRKEPALRDLPVLIITGIKEQIAFMFPGQAVHPRFMPVDELLEKPVEPELLLEKVRALLAVARPGKGEAR